MGSPIVDREERPWPRYAKRTILLHLRIIVTCLGLEVNQITTGVCFARGDLKRPGNIWPNIAKSLGFRSVSSHQIRWGLGPPRRESKSRTQNTHQGHASRQGVALKHYAYYVMWTCAVKDKHFKGTVCQPPTVRKCPNPLGSMSPKAVCGFGEFDQSNQQVDPTSGVLRWCRSRYAQLRYDARQKDERGTLRFHWNPAGGLFALGA